MSGIKRVVDSPQEQAWPHRFDTEEQLEAFLTRPSAALRDFARTLASPLLILGAGGKMGPTLAILAKRAAEAVDHPLEVIAASRFSDKALAVRLEQHDIKTIACDLLDSASVQKLPDAPNLLYLVGLKFGTEQSPSTTWPLTQLCLRA